MATHAQEGLPTTTPTVSRPATHSEVSEAPCGQSTLCPWSVVPAPGVQGARWGDIRPGLKSRASPTPPTCLSEPLCDTTVSLARPLCPSAFLAAWGVVRDPKEPPGSQPHPCCAGAALPCGCVYLGRTGLRSLTGEEGGVGEPPWRRRRGRRGG